MQSETARTGQSWDLNPGLLTLRLMLFLSAALHLMLMPLLFFSKEEKILTVICPKHYHSAVFGN